MSAPPIVPSTAVLRPEDVSLADLEAMRVILRGGSVIDWPGLSFANEAEVDRFLRANELDPSRAEDVERLEDLRSDAVEYLTRNFSYRIPDEVAGGLPARELFLLASSRGRRQSYACIVLKVMHVMHHLAGRELLFKLPVSDDQVFALVEAKVVKVVEEIRAAGYPIAEFAWSRKERDSVVTKLLAKKASIAAHVYDKLRFRLVTRKYDDLAAVLNELQHRLIPFNYVIPGESLNGLLPFRHMVEHTPAFARFADRLPLFPDEEAPPATNEFSGPSYRIINFVADLPVRVDELALAARSEGDDDLGSIIFVLTEFQVMDADTAQKNEAGENSHSAYKERQHDRVKRRLLGPAKEQADRSSQIVLDDDD